MWPDEGDPQLGSFVVNHIAALRDLGVAQKVVVWSGRSEAPLPLAGVEVFAGPAVAPGPRGWNAKIRAVLNLGRPSLLHVHGSGGDSAYLFLRSIMQWGQRIPRVVSEHQYYGDGALPTGVAWTHRLANARTAVSPFLAERFAHLASGRHGAQLLGRPKPRPASLPLFWRTPRAPRRRLGRCYQGN